MEEYDVYFRKGLCNCDIVTIFNDLYNHCQRMHSHGLSIKDARLFFQSCKSQHNKNNVVLTHYNKELIEPVYKSVLFNKYKKTKQNIHLLSKQIQCLQKGLSNYEANLKHFRKDLKEYEI